MPVRGLEMVSLPALLHLYAVQWLGVTMPPRLVASAVSRRRAGRRGGERSSARGFDRAVVSWSVVILRAALLLSTVWSPQWMLWVLPLMILTARTTGDVPDIVAYGVIGYLVFPLIHDGLHGLESIPVRFGSFVVYGILIRTVVVAYRRDDQRGVASRRAKARRSP